MKKTQGILKRSIKTKERLKMEKELKISADDALKAYKNADKYGKKILEDLFGKEFYKIDIKERVKCFGGAITALGMDNQAVKDYYAIARKTSTEDIIAFAKLRVIAEALNEGWKPKFDGDECRYYPWFYIYTKAEYEELDEDEKKDCRVVGRSYTDAFAYSGVVCVGAFDASSGSVTGFGSRLAFKTRELAEYCGKQFIDIWERFLFA